MGWWNTLYEGAKYYVAAPLSLGARVVFNTGQAVFYMEKAQDYFHFEHKTRLWMDSTSAIGTLGSTLLRNTIPIFQTCSSQESVEVSADQNQPLGLAARMVRFGLLSAGATYGLLTSLAGYLSTELLSEAIAYLFNTEIHDPHEPWKEILVEAAGISVSLLYLGSYYSYDYQVIKKNVSIISQAIHEHHFACNQAMLKTLAFSSLNFYIYPSQAFFTTDFSLDVLPSVKNYIGFKGIQFLAGTAAFTTALTVITWLPSVYDFFSTTSVQSQRSVKETANTYFSWTIRAGSYLTGAIDSLGCNGLGPALSVILTLNQLSGKTIYEKGSITLYGATVIGFGTLCGINAGLVNFSFSILPGLQKLLQAIYTQPVTSYSVDIENPTVQEDTLIIDLNKTSHPIPIDSNRLDNYHINSSSRFFSSPPKKSSPVHTNLVELQSNKIKYKSSSFPGP